MPDKATLERAKKDKREGKAHSRRQARGAVGQAGDCDRLVESTTGGRRSSAAQKRRHVGANATECGKRISGGTGGRSQGFTGSIARHDACVEARGPGRGVEAGAFQACPCSGG
jgi:hypothetical protein